MLDLLDKYVIGPWTTIWSTAPVPFVMSLAAIAIILFITMKWGYGREISLLKTQVADYRDKLKGATPEEAKAKIDALERTVGLTIGQKWEPLTKREVDSLAAKLKGAPNKIRVQIMYENALGKDLAQSLYDAFKQAEWKGAFLGPGSGLGPGVTVGQGSKDTVIVKDAIESASRLEVEIIRPVERELPGLIFLAVGINVI